MPSMYIALKNHQILQEKRKNPFFVYMKSDLRVNEFNSFRKLIFPTKNPLATQPVCCSSGEKMCQLATLCWPQMKTPHIEEDQTPFHNLIVQSLSKYCLSWFSHISVRFPSRGRHLSKYFFFDVLLQRNCYFYEALFVLNIALNRILTIMYTYSILFIPPSWHVLRIITT